MVSSLGEMVSLIPEAGAIMEMPNRFLDEAFGWTVAIMYWFVYAMGMSPSRSLSVPRFLPATRSVRVA